MQLSPSPMGSEAVFRKTVSEFELGYRTPWDSQVAVKNLSANAGDVGVMGWIPGLGRSPGEGNGNPLQFFCLENPMDRRAWWARVHGVTKSQT